jgi:hypothetical protein
VSDYEIRQRELSQKRNEMFEFAKSVGSDSAIMENLGELWFKTWQEALDFQMLAKEQGIELTLIEADPKPVSFAGEYYKLVVQV